MAVELGQSRLATLSKRGDDDELDMTFNLDEGCVFPPLLRAN